MGSFANYEFDFSHGKFNKKNTKNSLKPGSGPLLEQDLSFTSTYKNLVNFITLN